MELLTYKKQIEVFPHSPYMKISQVLPVGMSLYIAEKKQGILDLNMFWGEVTHIKDGHSFIKLTTAIKGTINMDIEI